MNKVSKIWLAIRILIGLMMVPIEVGSALEGDWGTTLIALALTLFLVVPPQTIKGKIKLPYIVVLPLMLIAFVGASNLTMTAFDQDNHAKKSAPAAQAK